MQLVIEEKTQKDQEPVKPVASSILDAGTIGSNDSISSGGGGSIGSKGSISTTPSLRSISINSGSDGVAPMEWMGAFGILPLGFHSLGIPCLPDVGIFGGPLVLPPSRTIAPYDHHSQFAFLTCDVRVKAYENHVFDPTNPKFSSFLDTDGDHGSYNEGYYTVGTQTRRKRARKTSGRGRASTVASTTTTRKAVAMMERAGVVRERRSTGGNGRAF